MRCCHLRLPQAPTQWHTLDIVPLTGDRPLRRSNQAQADLEKSDDHVSQAATFVPSVELEARGPWGKEGQEG